MVSVWEIFPLIAHSSGSVNTVSKLYRVHGHASWLWTPGFAKRRGHWILLTTECPSHSTLSPGLHYYTSWLVLVFEPAHFPSRALFLWGIKASRRQHECIASLYSTAPTNDDDKNSTNHPILLFQRWQPKPFGWQLRYGIPLLQCCLTSIY